MNFRKMTYRIAGIGILLIIGIALGVSSAHNKSQKCNSLEIHISTNTADPLISAADIEKQLKYETDSLRGSKLKDIDPALMEKVIMRNSCIKDAHVYININGNVNIDVTQRIPRLRIINKKNQERFMDAEGYLIDTDPSYPQHLPVVNGNIHYDFEKLPENNRHYKSLDSLYKDQKLENIHHFAVLLGKYPSLAGFIQQIYVNKKREFELIPKLGNHIILLGSSEKLDMKFENLIAFYKYSIGNEGWRIYKTINLKYNKQVICKK